MIRKRSLFAAFMAVSGILAASATTADGSAAAGVEISREVDGPFRALFRDANLLEIKQKEATNWFAVSALLPGKSVYYELTLSDALNKKFKVEFGSSGEIRRTDKFQIQFERLPAFVQAAIEQQGAVTDLQAVLQCKVEYLKSDMGFHVSGKINGSGIDVKVPIAPRGITPEAVISWNRRPVNVFKTGDPVTDKNTLSLISMSTPYEANFSYAWSLVSGEELHLTPADLVKDRLSLQIQKAGKYVFRLSVSDGNTSVPAEVEVEVLDPK